jgi:hypothetical protein
VQNTGSIFVTARCSRRMAALPGAASPAGSTRVRMCQVLNSADCNKLNTVAMGPILRWMDIAACLSAEKLALTCCVTLSMDHLLFDNSMPVEHGTTILIEAQVSSSCICIPFSAPTNITLRWSVLLVHQPKLSFAFIEIRLCSHFSPVLRVPLSASLPPSLCSFAARLSTQKARKSGRRSRRCSLRRNGK